MPSDFFKTVYNAVSVVRDTIEDMYERIEETIDCESLERRTKSAEKLRQLQSVMESMQANALLSLREKKTLFLKQANGYVMHLITADLMTLFRTFQRDIHEAEHKYLFIYAEDDEKPIGWLKKNVMFTKNPMGNTNTHKKFLGMMKDRALTNIAKLDENTARFKRESREIQPLMQSTRGRTGNAVAWAGLGYEGAYRDAVKR